MPFKKWFVEAKEFLDSRFRPMKSNNDNPILIDDAKVKFINYVVN